MCVCVYVCYCEDIEYFLSQQLRAKSKSEMGSITVARLPINQGRNRYRDVLACELACGWLCCQHELPSLWLVVCQFCSLKCNKNLFISIFTVPDAAFGVHCQRSCAVVPDNPV